MECVTRAVHSDRLRNVYHRRIHVFTHTLAHRIPRALLVAPLWMCWFGLRVHADPYRACREVSDVLAGRCYQSTRRWARSLYLWCPEERSPCGDTEGERQLLLAPRKDGSAPG